MKRTILSICLSVIFIFSTTTYCFADVDLNNPPTEPTKPQVENYKDNDKIENYNKEVENYNQEAQEYNKAVDEEYDKAVKKVDEQNKAEQERVNKANEEKTKQYESDKEQYEKDKEFEEKVLADPRYDSLEQYNETVKNYNDKIDTYNQQVTNYHEAYGISNEDAEKSPERNNSAPEVKPEDTYVVEESETNSGRKIPVHIEHIFTGTDVKYSIDFEIDANSTITLMGIAPQGDYLDDKSCFFFYKTDDNHLLGMWANMCSYLLTNPTATVEDGWLNGDTHTVTYADSTDEYQWEFEDISITYEYMWIPLYKMREHYPYANVPKEPILKLEEFKALSYPQKRGYLNYLSTLPYFKEPLKKEEAEKIQKSIDKNNVQAKHTTKTNNNLNVTIGSNNNLNPTPVKTETKKDTKNEIIEDKTPPMAQFEIVYWALINLIATLITFLIAIILLLMILVNKRKKEDEIKIHNRIPGRLFSIIVAIVTGLIFLITEDMSLPMALIDKWTPLMIILLIVQIIVMIFCKHKKIKKEEE